MNADFLIDPSSLRMPRGKFKGLHLGELPDAYLQWLFEF